MKMDQEVDLATQLPGHPLDPYRMGRLVTRRVNEQVEIVDADDRVLLDCGLLWDIVANYEVFSPWVKLTPPEHKLDLKANFGLAQGFSLLALGDAVRTNRPTIHDSRPMCQHWLLNFTVGSRKLAYRVGSYRPKSNTMEATNVLAAQ